MATNNDAWDNMFQIAEIQQQEYYELLAEWTIYNKDEYKYLKQNIGFSIFGPPTESDNSAVVCCQDVVLYQENATNINYDIIDSLHYSSKAEKIINTIFKKICTFGEMDFKRMHEKCIKYICYGVIFNVTLPIKTSSLKESEIYAQPTPIFKIRRLKDEVWYIDISGRVYKSWEDYKTDNTLPKCTMVLPMNGFYQCNNNYDVTEEYSKVWLEIVNSPACKITKKILGGVDIATTIVGVAGMGIGIASMVTPIGPVLLGAAAFSSVSTGAWGIGRSTQNLIDRSTHEESISFADRNALCSWLTITGGAIGLAASGGSILLVKAVRQGSNISAAAKFAFNSVTVGNVALNGVGIAFQGYCMYTKYQEEKVISSLDVLNLATHVLFFGNAVMNMQLAGNLIESTQGRILDDYRNSLRTKRLRKSYNRAKRAAAENNVEKFHENAEVIRYINQKTEMLLKQNHVATKNRVSAENVFTKNLVTFEGGKIKLNGMTLLDPLKFVSILLQEEEIRRENYSSERSSNMETDNPVISELKNLLLDLLNNYSITNGENFEPNFNSYEYDQIIYDMKNIENASEALMFLFKLGTLLIKRSHSVPEVLGKAVYFLWRYIQMNLKEMCLDATTSIEDPTAQNILNKFIICMFEHGDNVVQTLIPAFIKFLSLNY